MASAALCTLFFNSYHNSKHISSLWHCLPTVRLKSIVRSIMNVLFFPSIGYRHIHIFYNEIVLSHEKEWNCAILKAVDGLAFKYSNFSIKLKTSRCVITLRYYSSKILKEPKLQCWKNNAFIPVKTLASSMSPNCPSGPSELEACIHALQSSLSWGGGT